MRTGRRCAWLTWLPALGALASCGIPTTGVVEAGGPASGVVPTIRVYFVADGALRGVDRRIAGPVDLESAVRVLLKGPTPAEQAEGLSTLMPPVAFVPATSLFPTDTPTQEHPEAARSSDPVKATSRDGRVTIRLSVNPGNPADLAAAQLICTAVAAQRVLAPGTAPLPVTVTGPSGLDTRGSGRRCPR
ncbi:hypothetical protein GCM10022403_001140 [Streptomyces coacervatus]|uniref:GerMN domain-containing protein n=1 Tax=Streptomyces coacervatus TaxID=647381 RepID=A0ABP7GQI7_9ACTN|nr:hypothetical protein [Streptomyces coacervatus]MDF2264600.1 hypothetical protein [Streptomyces coacervatus]